MLLLWRLRSVQTLKLIPKLKIIPNYKFLSTADVFEKVDASIVDKLSTIPPPPSPPPYKLSIEELYHNGNSVISELNLFTWWKPSGYFRYALEYIHQNFDLPWWTTIVCATCILRLALIYVPIMSQKFVAKQSEYKPELQVFRTRLSEAKQENNSLLMQQILLEQRDFMVSKGIKFGRQFLILGINGTIFMTQFFAIKKMVAVYPGFSNGGMLWFSDLTACDPYYILPILSSLTLTFVMKQGIESGTSTDQMTPLMRAAFTYGIPFVVLVSSSQFSSAVCLYWCTSNFISLLYSYLFKLSKIRQAFNLPPIVKDKDKKQESFSSAWKNYKAEKNAPPSINTLREKDAKQFKKAGRGKPILKVD